MKQFSIYKFLIAFSLFMCACIAATGANAQTGRSATCAGANPIVKKAEIVVTPSGIVIRPCSGTSVNIAGAATFNNLIPTTALGTGTASSTTYLRGNNTWGAVTIPNIAIGTTATGFTNSIYAGYLSGSSLTSGNYHTFFGTRAGAMITTGTDDTLFGYGAGTSLTTGFNNTMIGDSAGANSTMGNNNTFLGSGAGNTNLTGSGNTFIGTSAGLNELGSNKLYIANSATATPLIYGDFSGAALTINGSLTATGKLNLPTTCASGGTLTSSAATITTSCATTSSRIMLTRTGTSGTGGVLYVTSKAAGSFVVNSASASDAGTFDYLIIN